MRTFPKGENGDRNWLNHPISLTLIAFAFTSAPALLLHKWSEKNLGSLTAMALALLIGGIVMWIVDAWASAAIPHHHVEEMTLARPSGSASARRSRPSFPEPRAPCPPSPPARWRASTARRPRVQLPALHSHHDRRHLLGPAQGDSFPRPRSPPPPPTWS
jgi:hypothetical protein